MPESDDQEEPCRFCSNGMCLLCQIAAPMSPYVSSSHGRLVDTNAGNLGNGNHRTAMPSGDKSGARSEEAPAMSKGKLCPLCKLPFIDLAHHYRKRHPGAKVEF